MFEHELVEELEGQLEHHKKLMFKVEVNGEELHGTLDDVAYDSDQDAIVVTVFCEPE